MKLFDTQIEFNTFLKKKCPPIDDRHGVWYITGKQGSGKTYYSVKLLCAQDVETCAHVYTNIHSLKVPGYKIRYFTKLKEIYNNVEEHCIFIIDEISKKYHKNSPTDKEFYAWLNQSRKRKRIVILITQEWRELPMWIRRPAKYMLSTRKCILSPFGIYITILGDAENLVFNKDEGEYECPTIRKIISKRNMEIAKLYDTFEPIQEL